MRPGHPTHPTLLRLAAPPPGAAREDAGALLARLAGDGVHELAETRFGDHAAATGLALAALAAHARPGPLLWVTQGAAGRPHGRLWARGAEAAGLDPGRLLLVAAGRLPDALWTVEEGLRSAAVAAVVAEVTDADFTATRRLALAAGTTGVPAVLLLPQARGGATAAEARWRVAAAPSAPDPHDPRAPGRSRWRLGLERSRRAPWAAGRTWEVEWDDATLSLSVADGLEPRPAAAGGPGHGLARTG